MKRYVFYIVDNIEHVNQAMISASSVIRHTDNVEAILFHEPMSDDFPLGVFSAKVALPKSERGNWWFYRAMAMKSAVEHFAHGNKLIFLDCDTFATESLEDIFATLGEYTNISMVHAPRRYPINYTQEDTIPASFPEYNCGVMAFYYSSVIDELLKISIEEFAEMGGYGAPPAICDQDSLRAALWFLRGKINMHTMPTEYNCRFSLPFAVGKKVVLLHGHPNPHTEEGYQRIAGIVNKQPNKMRAWTGAVK